MAEAETRAVIHGAGDVAGGTGRPACSLGR